MADYYSLIARKIGPLAESTPQSRQAIYELARKALFNQLRAIQPPVAEQVIQTEGRALDEAIARLEMEAAKSAPTRAASPAMAPRPEGEPKSRVEKSERENGGPENNQPPRADAKNADSNNAAKNADANYERSKSDARNVDAQSGVRNDAAPREQQRPAAPLPAPVEASSGTRRLMGIGAIVLVLVAFVALAAMYFRERPEDLAKLKPDESAGESTEHGKFADRVGGERSGGAAVPIAQKAQLVIATAQHPEKIEHAYNGSVVWRLENIGGGDGQPIKSAIRGDMDFPDIKSKASLVIQKNLDPTLSMSHTINISFKFPPGGDLKGVAAIDVLRVRRSEAQSGDKLQGVQAPITENNFLIGLMRGDGEARNLALLRTPGIIDLPMQLSDGRLATINLEKGASGERVFNDAINSWAR